MPTAQAPQDRNRSEEHTSELQSHHDLVCRLLLEKKKEVSALSDAIVFSASAAASRTMEYSSFAATRTEGTSCCAWGGHCRSARAAELRMRTFSSLRHRLSAVIEFDPPTAPFSS